MEASLPLLSPRTPTNIHVCLLLAGKFTIKVQENDGEHECYGAEEDMEGLHLKASGLQVGGGALLLTEAVLLHALHCVEDVDFGVRGFNIM